MNLRGGTADRWPLECQGMLPIRDPAKILARRNGCTLAGRRLDATLKTMRVGCKDVPRGGGCGDVEMTAEFDAAGVIVSGWLHADGGDMGELADSTRTYGLLDLVTLRRGGKPGMSRRGMRSGRCAHGDEKR